MKKVQIQRLSVILTALCFIVSVSLLNAQVLHIQVDAGAFDRTNSIVEFQLPSHVEPGLYALESTDGSQLPLQVDHENRGWFILPELHAGKSITYTLQPDQHELNRFSGGVKLDKDANTLAFSTSVGPVLHYFHGTNTPPETLDDRYKRGGYIHPVFSPEGVELTNHLNAQQHPHHAGIWSAWTNTIFDGNTPDFWNLHQNTGRVDIDTLMLYWDGVVTGGFISRHHFMDLSGDESKIALNELWEVRVFDTPQQESNAYHVFDLMVTQTTNTDKPLVLPEYRYGGIGFRGHQDWDDPSRSDFLTSEGLGRDGHAQRSRWVHMGGFVGDHLAGFAIMGHPTNYRFPQPTRIHPSEPFFNYAPTQLGEMRIEPGLPYKTTLRIVSSDGEPNAALLNRLWNDFAYPPGVSVFYP